MKKLLSLAVVFGFAVYLHAFGLEPSGESSLGVGGMNYVTVTSSQVAFPRAGVIYKVYSSTGNNQTDWFQLFDTNPVLNTATLGYNTFVAAGSSITMTPQTIFQSTNTTTNPTLNLQYDFTPYGLLASTGCYVYFSAGTIGQIRSVTILYKK